MEITDFHNKAAFAKAIKNYFEKFKHRTCLSPQRDCQGPIVSAHTISAQAMLRPISKNGHVYAIETDMFKLENGRPFHLRKKGIKETSVFFGFCSKHDKDLFSPIEDDPFICSPKQLFLHAFRAVAKESYVKPKSAEAGISPEELKEIHGLPHDFVIEPSLEEIIVNIASTRGAEEIARIKEMMDEYYLTESWGRIVTTVIPFTKMPTIVCNFIYSPDFDFEGNYLQNFADMRTDLSPLMITIFPHVTGGYAFLSYLDTANRAPRQMIQSLIQPGDVTSRLACLVAQHAENIAISPVWYESLSAQEQAKLLNAIGANADPYDNHYHFLKDCQLRVESWEPGPAFTI